MHLFRHLLIISLAIFLFSGVVLAESLTLRNDHPERYTVVKGDTLWDISAMFLRDPWRWPDIWHVNQQIKNPHLIYPGDVLVLTYIDGKPRLVLERGPLRLSPKIRSKPIDTAIPVIPLDAIKPFLSRPYVVQPGELEQAPYIVAFADEHMMGGAGQRIYVRTIDNANERKFDVVRKGVTYHDHQTNEILGHEAIFIGNAELQRTGDPATLLLSRTAQEALVGDRLFPVTEEVILQNFHPKSPDREVDGAIINVMNGVTQIGQFNIVVLDRGESDGLSIGDVLQIDHAGELIKDPVSPEPNDKIKLPDERAGLLMVFRLFDRISFGIVLNATRSIHVNDRVHNP